MCGITGWIDWADDLTNQHAILERMVCTLEHRGPDAEGFWLSPRAAFAHRRLIVIDPQGGKQPMLYAQDGRTYTITYNGEIYNFRELKTELQARGHQFRTHSDTEVVLHTYAEWGEDCVHHLNGIFAFAIWDEHQQRLFIARDHLGVKPLYYAQRGSAVIFGSELKSLLAHPLVKSEVDAEGLAELFSGGPMRTPGAAVFKDIHELRPGHTLICTHNNVDLTCYWRLQSYSHTDDLAATVEHIRALLEDTVRHQLIADMPVASLLSGGLDSSGLTSMAGREFQREHKKLQTYSMEFVSSDRDFHASALRPSLDTPWIKKVSEYVGTEHHTVTLDTDDLIENFNISLRAHDLPGLGQMDVSLYLLFKEMKKHATVALSGESADEVFGGYPWFHEREVASTLTLSGRFSRSASILSSEAEKIISPLEYAERRNREIMAEVPLLGDEDEVSIKRRELFYDHMVRFLPMLLERKDRMSMATGFEVRVPFCDYRLVQYVWNIPWEMKTVDDIEKGILRRAFAGYLPHDALYRKKSAYPASQNPAYLQFLQKWALSILDDPQAPIQQLLDSQKVRALVEGDVQSNPAEFDKKDMLDFTLNHIIQTNQWLKEYNISIVV